MNRHAINISAVFLKDLRQLWPMAVLAAATILASQLIDFSDTPGMVQRLLVPLGPPLISAFFLVGLVHQDAPASLSHEWLTRPVGGPDVIAAKFLMLVAAVMLPMIIGPTISAARDGTPVLEALLLAISDTAYYWVMGFALLVVAVVTSTLIQTAGVLIGVFVLFLLASPLIIRNGMPVIGTVWLIIGAMAVVALVGGSVVLWLQYAAHRTNVARGALGATIVLIGAVPVLPQHHNVLLAMQAGVTGHHPAADGFNLALVPDCFEATYIEQLSPGIIIGNRPLTDAERRVPVVTFSTITRAQGLPEGWRMLTMPQGRTVIDSGGMALDHLDSFRRPSSEPLAERKSDMQNTSQNTWTIKRERFDDLARQAAGLRFDYDVYLLEPVHTGEIAADGKRHSLPGLGTCVADASSGTFVQVSCFKAGFQPDSLIARLSGDKNQGAGSNYTSFAPGLLQSSPGIRHNMRLMFAAPGEQPRVTITAYKARAIVTRSVTAPGMLGGPSCSPAS